MIDPKQKIEKNEIIKTEGPASLDEKLDLPEKERKIEDIYEGIAKPDEGAESAGQTAEKPGIVASSNAQSDYQQRQKQIEKFLEKGLADEFLKMNPADQQEFRRVGEETAIKINVLLDSGKVKIKKIIDLIKKWLLLIPGVNKFFVEQEAKIKADEIVQLKNQE